MMAKVQKIGTSSDGRTLYGIRPPHDHVKPWDSFTFCFTEELIKKYKVKEEDLVEIIYGEHEITIKFI